VVAVSLSSERMKTQTAPSSIPRRSEGKKEAAGGVKQGPTSSTSQF
jgi:hypothetical protein